MKNRLSISRKKPHLYLTLTLLWILIVALSVPSFSWTFSELDTAFARVLIIPFFIFLVIFWFFGLYHIVFGIFSYSVKRPDVSSAGTSPGTAGPPGVAIIYCTLNDFNKEAITTCIMQKYPNYRLFILDVSTNENMKKQVDEFHKEFSSETTLVRLPPRPGFKARSLNDTLKTAVPEDYQFFAVCDADNYWPVDFLEKMMAYFKTDDKLAFVQAKAHTSKQSPVKFARDFESAINASWTLHQLARNKYGLLMCMGHSVVVRREAWEKSGGYPEIVQEDTAFTMRLKEHGYYGIFAPEISCDEEFPEDFRRWRRRQFRLVQADTEILYTQMPGFLKSSMVSLVEKIDILARSSRIPLQSSALLFLLLTFIFIPLANGAGFSQVAIDRTFSGMINPFPIIFTLLLAAGPLYPFIIYLRNKIPVLLKLSLGSITIHYSIMSVALVSFVVYLLRGKAMFLVTGSQDGSAIQSQPTSAFQSALQKANADSRIITWLEIICGLALGYMGVSSGSLIVIGIALIMLSSALLKKLEWGNGPAVVLVYLPSLLIFSGTVAALFNIFGAQSQYLALAVCAILLF